MDIEATLRALTEQHIQAIKRHEAAERRMDKAEQRVDKADQRMEKVDRRMDRLDKQLLATANLVRAGVKLVIDLRQSQKETGFKLRALIDTQQRTEIKLNRFLESMGRRGTNGHR